MSIADAIRDEGWERDGVIFPPPTTTTPGPSSQLFCLHHSFEAHNEVKRQEQTTDGLMKVTYRMITQVKCTECGKQMMLVMPDGTLAPAVSIPMQG